MRYLELDVQKKVMRALLESLEIEDRNALARYALSYAEEEKVVEKVAKDKDYRIEGLNNIIKTLRPTINEDLEMKKALALLRFENKFRYDEEIHVAGIEHIKVVERNPLEGTTEIEISYYEGNGCVDEWYTTIKKGDVLEYTIKR